MKFIKYFLSHLMIGLFLILLNGCGGDNETSSKFVELNASVSHSNLQFTIKNNDDFDYKNVKMEVNGEYTLIEDKLEAGKTYTVGFMQFADSKGNRFTNKLKPLKFSITCDLDDSKHGSYFAGWK